MSGEEVPTQFVTAELMAETLGVKTASVRRWARRGSIPKLILPGGRYAFDPVAVITALRKGSASGGESRG